MSDQKNLFMQALQNAHDKCLIELNGSTHQKSPALYHYTDLESCASILSNGTLRLTDIRYCNDPLELEEGLSILNKMKTDLLNFYNKNQPAFAHTMDLIIYGLNVALCSHKETESYVDNFKKNPAYASIDTSKLLALKTSCYLACFSEKEDDLRQWIPYSNNGAGVAIGFKGLDGNHFLTEDPEMYVVKVCYENNLKKEKFVENLFHELSIIFSSIRVPTNSFNLFVENVHTALMFDIIACKSENYSDEKEWRLISYTQQNTADVNFRVKENILRPYIEKSLKKDSVLDIKLGPKSERELNASSISSLLLTRNYTAATVTESDIKYRG